MKYLVAALTFLFPIYAHAADKYCLADASKYTLHIFGNSLLNDLHKRDFLRGVDALNDRLDRGDSVKIVLHRPQGDYRVTLDACVPGCPKTSLVDSLTAECSAQIAKRDRVNFKGKFLASVKGSLSQSGTDYNVFEDLVTLSDYYRGRNSEGENIYAFHSLVPNAIGSSGTKADYDKAFVDLVQNQKSLPEELPAIAFVNSDTSKLNFEFWKNIETLVRSDSLEFVTLE
jgi:hypothetical protein